MHRLFPAVTGLTFVLSAALLGCQSAPLRDQVGRLEHEVARLQSHGDRLEERLAAVELAQQELARDEATAAADPTPSPVRNKLAVVRVGPGASSPGRGEEAFMEVESVDDGARRPALEAAPAVVEYEGALELVKSRRYPEAARAFAHFLERYPSHPHADNALYWSGECAYASGDYRGATHRFGELIARYPAGNKVPDALLKLGMSQRALGEEAAARESFTLLRRQFPTTEAAARLEGSRF
jgi:tol-pal system protein YbgF